MAPLSSSLGRGLKAGDQPLRCLFAFPRGRVDGFRSLAKHLVARDSSRIGGFAETPAHTIPGLAARARGQQTCHCRARHGSGHEGQASCGVEGAVIPWFVHE